ncbi:hypothetical protein LCGC14_0294890 [marine sediment metagenome]|uniref:Uncharacterized protein n=1 Tax=marine sediment metagenome TaxID=412755 RepID=A0A0F9WDD7_9ZZZZ
MTIKPRPVFTFPFADTATPFDVTLTTPATAEDLVLVPSTKKGRVLSLVNEGPGAVALAFDATAVVTDLLLEEGDAYDEQNLEISTNVSFINVTASQSPRIRGILWSGD